MLLLDDGLELEDLKNKCGWVAESDGRDDDDPAGEEEDDDARAFAMEDWSGASMQGRWGDACATLWPLISFVPALHCNLVWERPEENLVFHS